MSIMAAAIALAMNSRRLSIFPSQVNAARLMRRLCNDKRKNRSGKKNFVDGENFSNSGEVQPAVLIKVRGESLDDTQITYL
jgi:hypothetical protein